MTFLCNGTPDITVCDNRGQPVRQLRYNRRDSQQAVDELIERRELALTGQPLTLTDARFFAAGNGTANFRYITSLSGKALRQTSMDAGDVRGMFNAAGKCIWASDGRGTQTCSEFDALGRPVSLTQQDPQGEAARIIDRFIYGETLSDARDRNLRGQCIEHYDAGGRLQTGALALTGQTQQQTRWLLADEEQEANWQGEDQSVWQAQLEATGYLTQSLFNACGQPVLMLDAKGNQQHQQYNIAGQVTGNSLLMADGSEKTVIGETTFNAAGNILHITAAGSVTRTFSYEDTTQRLLTVVTERAGETLEDVLYGYDPAGNIISLTDRRQATRWFAGQQVEASQHWQYDALYQLISASGRENASAGVQSPALPATTSDASQVVNYQRTYSYDDSYNLVSIAHSGAQQYTQRMIVSSGSNRAVSDALATDITADQVDGYFDACGNALWLQAGQALNWSAANRLAQVTLVDRGDGENDREIYQYDSQGNRLRKTTLTLTGSTTQTQQVIYLPGLELRTTTTDSAGKVTVNDALVVNVLAGGPGIAVRHLYREQGQDDAITAAGQLRLNMGNTIDSVMLELDGDGAVLSREEYFPFGGTAILAGDSAELKYKYIRYSGKERDGSGLYYYGQRYYMPWLGRWASSDPVGTVDGSNLYRMVRNNPVGLRDNKGLAPGDGEKKFKAAAGHYIDVRRSVLNSREKVMDPEIFSTHVINRRRQQALEDLLASYRASETTEPQLHTVFKILNLVTSKGGAETWKSGLPLSEGVGQFWTNYETGAKDVAQFNAYRAGNGGTVEMTKGGGFLDTNIPFDALLGQNWNEDREMSISLYRAKKAQLSLDDPDYFTKSSVYISIIKESRAQMHSVSTLLSSEKYRAIGGAGAKYIWDMLSISFAAGASSAQFNVQHGVAVPMAKTWALIEKPILKARGVQIKTSEF